MFTPDDLAACLRVLRALAEDPSRLAELPADTRRALLEAAGAVSRPTRDERRRIARAFRRKDRTEARAHDASVVARSLNREARRSSGFVLPSSAATAERIAALPPHERPAAELRRPRDCYVCKAPFTRVHPFYDQLCPTCADLNWEKRHQTARLDGRVAVVTGARIKIGFQAALILLRAGCRVLATSRFPRDAAERFAREPDFASFAERLSVHGLDLRHAPSVESFARHLDQALPRLDFLVNNAAQTVRRPAAYYRGLAAREAEPLASLPPAVRPLLAAPAPARAMVAADEAHFPSGTFDLDGEPVDLRRVNSWRLTADEVPTVELLEVLLVNAVAPFLLVARLRPLLARTPGRDHHVVNVSAMEAQFARRKKTDKHPHTNMAKAALNMLTRTSAVDYQRDGIHMNSVDTGWITDEDPLHHVDRKQRVHDFHPPLDAIDGAARVLDPIFTGLRTGQHPWGLFFKDYRPTDW